MERFTDGPTGSDSSEEPKVDKNKAILNYIMTSLRATRPWTRLLSILGFIGVAFVLVSGIAMIMGGKYLPISEKVPPLAFMGIIYILTSVLYLVPSIWLSKYSTAITRFPGEGDALELGKAIAYQKSFWKFIGILALVSIGFTVLGILAAILIPTFLAVRS